MHGNYLCVLFVGFIICIIVLFVGFSSTEALYVEAPWLLKKVLNSNLDYLTILFEQVK